LIAYSYHPLAECDVREAAHYFESRSPGLGAQFRLSLLEAVTLLRQHPEIAPVLRGNLRCKVLLRFGYNIIHAIESGELRIYAVVSQYRRPESWSDRLGAGV